MNIFITLLENVNKSRTSAGNLSLIYMYLARNDLKKRTFYMYLACNEKVFSLNDALYNELLDGVTHSALIAIDGGTVYVAVTASHRCLH
jgi:hypothetical protein